MPLVLAAAGFYNLGFASWSALQPSAWCAWLGIIDPACPMRLQGVAIILGVLGIGYLIAARDPVRHWLIVLVGFLGKTFCALGLLGAVSSGALPLPAMWIALTSHAVWIVPFAMILWAATRAHLGRPPAGTAPLTIEEAAARFQLSTGESLAEASRDRTLAMVFLRHFGCTFTRQFLRHLEQIREDAESRGGRLVLVHMLDRGEGRKHVRHKDDVARISDPSCELYRAFGLRKANFWELLGPIVWIKGFAAFFSGCRAGHLAGDGLQMPGAFLFRDGRVISAQPAKNAAQLPDIRRLFESPA